MRQSLPVHHLHLHPQPISLVVQLLVQQSTSPSTIHLSDAKCVMCGEDLVEDPVQEQGEVCGQWLVMLVVSECVPALGRVAAQHEECEVQ